MADKFVIELRTTLKSFLANATDQQFCEMLADADQGVYSKIDIPVAALHKNITRVDAPIAYATFSGVPYLEATFHPDKPLSETLISFGETATISLSLPYYEVLKALGSKSHHARLISDNEERVDTGPALPVAA